MNAELLTKLKKLIDIHDRYQHSFYYSPAPSAASRRFNEAKNSVPTFSFTFGGDLYSLAYEYRETCKNIYAKGQYYRNGIRITVREIRKLVALIEKEEVK